VIPPNTPCVDRERVAQLRQHLIGIGFTEDGIRQAAGGTSQDPWSFTTSELRADDSPLSAVSKLFCFGVPVERRHAETAFAPLNLTDLQALGLVEISDGLVRPLHLIRPANGLFVTSDLPSSHADVVLGAVPASETLARLTVRRPATRALDLGTGCGVQALLLAQHASEVTAIDVNPRAVAFTTFNAALNELTNVQVREGSWLGPVEGERFDLIACNPPYVISPDTAYTYRDGGLTRDNVSRMVLGECARHLADGGFATILCNWIHDGDWAEAIRPWVDATGCDALLLHYATLDPRNYATRWNGDLQARDPRAFDAAVRRWLDYFRGEQIAQIAFGGVVLRRREGTSSHWVRGLEMSAGPTGSCSDQILRLFDAADFLESAADRDLFGHAFTLVEGHTVDQTLSFSDGKYAVAPAVFRCVPGLGLEARIDARALEVLLECRSDRSLGELAAATAGDRGEPVEAVSELVGRTVRQLVERGFMVPSSDIRQGGQAW
jgi:methylase of polypeptide subunit release factors